MSATGREPARNPEDDRATVPQAQRIEEPSVQPTGRATGPGTSPRDPRRDGIFPTRGPIPTPEPADPRRAAEVPQSPNFAAKLSYALQGIQYGVVTQVNLRIHLAVAVLAIVLGFALQVSLTRMMVVIVLCGAVIAAELLNTGIECAVNLVSPGYHPLAKAAKDTAAGAVFILALTAITVGAVIYIDAFMALLGT